MTTTLSARGTNAACGGGVLAKACLASMVVLLGLPEVAWALKPAAHADITQKACVAAGLPKEFCRRIATENFNTDAREWDDLHAHAQIGDGETACDAADKAARRLWVLGYDLRAALAAVRTAPTEDAVGRTAAIIGRALHTIQDNCAHHGMPNPQHAWYSLGDFCDGTRTSPDIQDDALACARVETTAVMATIAAAVRDAGVASVLGGYACPLESQTGDSQQQRTICDNRSLPAPWDACSFLGEADAWDGIDRQWRSAAVVPVLRAELAAGLAFEPARESICGGDERVLAAAVSDPVVDVAGGAPSCARVHLLCLGQADLDDHPFADEPTNDDDAAGGCATSGDGSLASLALVAMWWAARRSSAVQRRASRRAPRRTAPDRD